MRIKEISFHNLNEDLVIQNIKFARKKELMVGKSGAGKTQILSAIHTARQLAIGQLKKVTSAFEVNMKFSLLDNEAHEIDYFWTVKVGFIPMISSSAGESNIIVKEEALWNDKESLFFRNENKFKILNYESVPTPKENESLISQYREESKISEIYWEFVRVYFGDIEEDMARTLDEKLYEEVCHLFRRNGVGVLRTMGSHLSPFDQYGVAQSVDVEFYKALSARVLLDFQEIFPEIEDVGYRINESREYGIAIKCEGRWIFQKNISSGMLKSIWNIICFRMLPENAVLLLDEIENGLGVNCIENVCDIIMNERDDIQVVATSHHPYIINNILMDNWMIIQRKNNIVTSHEAAEFSLGKSKHDAYLQLVNKLQSF